MNKPHAHIYSAEINKWIAGTFKLPTYLRPRSPYGAAEYRWRPLFILSFVLFLSSFFPRLISAVADWMSIILLARLQTWRAIIFSRVCLSVCVSLTGTCTLQRWPILMKLSHTDPTVISFGRDHNGPHRPQRDRATPFWIFKKLFKKSQNSNFKILVHPFCVCVSCVLQKKIDSIRTKLTKEIYFESAPIAITQVGTRHPLPMLCARRCFAASTNALRRARSTENDPICCRQGMT